MQSGRSQSVVGPIPDRVQAFQPANTRGKHRVQAELKRLEQEARFLELDKGILYTALALFFGVVSSAETFVDRSFELNVQLLPARTAVFTVLGSGVITVFEPSRSSDDHIFGLLMVWQIGFVEIAISLFPFKLLANKPMEELEQIERMENASAACKEMLSNVETTPDPLLPM
ncbi:hypothetical protein V6N13_013547 [Hibiscus sabdariffa]|uniref:Uncharacterized protein n=1 Tax=Hibiscus sabdariffa TaxID=183260 RepID=A0ABR2BVG5_9ROSI